MLVYWSLRRLLELIVLRGRSEREMEIEILLLRHQLIERCYRRSVRCCRGMRGDRSL